MMDNVRNICPTEGELAALGRDQGRELIAHSRGGTAAVLRELKALEKGLERRREAAREEPSPRRRDPELFRSPRRDGRRRRGLRL